MKRFIKYPLIGLGILFALVIIFIILALCGVFRHKHPYECGTYFLERQLKEKEAPGPERENSESVNWIQEPDTIP